MTHSCFHDEIFFSFGGGRLQRQRVGMEDWEKSGTGVHNGKLTKNQYKVLKNSKKGLIILFVFYKFYSE